MVRATTLACGYHAYWLDLECLGDTPAEKNLDIYRMSDVYRGAAFTLITLAKSNDSIEAWRSWGGRVWTMPEALLSPNLRYKIGSDGPVIPITLHQLANKAYEHYDEETIIINSYSGRDPLERLERLSHLKAAIWRRDSAALAPKRRGAATGCPHQLHCKGSSNKSASHTQRRKCTPLWDFLSIGSCPTRWRLSFRLSPGLSMANDNDRIAERMVSMLPNRISPQTCWYSDDDVYQSNLWDIEPEIQVAGVTQSGALVLDGCHAATIRWKGFPRLAFETTFSLRRTIARALPFLFLGSAVGRDRAFFIVLGILLMLAAPFLVAYANSGRVLSSEPWLIGVKGVLTADQVTEHLYGGTLSGSSPRTSYTPSGSPFAMPAEDKIRQGNPSQFTHAVEARYRDRVYTLVDTLSGTLYYFVASRPPTVCLFTGREGGLGRFVLCSESCTINELHKETVVRMPSYISRGMLLCDWVALGGVDVE
ncbi:hypothetical protein BU15DRAFT_73575 [Melanogaster broomeanus]|nr:hypothetical protein BU15DRAFT_73575 [Melanogaster broomeanus]